MYLTNKTKTWSAKDAFMAVKSNALSDYVGIIVTVQAVAIGTDVSADTGKEMRVGYIRAHEEELGTIMLSTISRTAIDQLEALIEMNEENIKLEICEQACKKDDKNKFVYFDFAD